MENAILRTIAIILWTTLNITGAAAAEELPLTGNWVVNHELSDDTDIAVEKSIKKAGGKVKRARGKKGKIRGRHKGGPEDQALYDHVAYDEFLEIEQQGTRFSFTHADGFKRTFFADNRGRVVSASGSHTDDDQDFSFGYWEDGKLVVESRPRDGGNLTEVYAIVPETGQLRVELYLEPLKFPVPIDIVRIFDAAASIETVP